DDGTSIRLYAAHIDGPKALTQRAPDASFEFPLSSRRRTKKAIARSLFKFDCNSHERSETATKLAW
ncbi:MAG TPA: hypothetical protein VGE52_18790, partial [Pirellulales bacterium]